MAALRVLAIAVATGRIGYVFLKGGELCDWALSRKASRDPKAAAEKAQEWIDELEPDVVVTEELPKRSRKGSRTRAMIEAITRVAERANVLDITISAVRVSRNKYDEAERLAERFPEISAWAPAKRRIWESEPRNTIYFEALALAVVVMTNWRPWDCLLAYGRPTERISILHHSWIDSPNWQSLTRTTRSDGSVETRTEL